MPLAPMSRRTFLRSAGACIGLPLLDAMLPVGLGAAQQVAAMRKKRLVLMGRGLGLHAPFFFPERTGRDYQPSRYLRLLQDYRRDFTVFSGMSHRGYPGGHGTEVALLTGLPPERIRPGDIRNTISLDQEVAERIGGETRFPYLSLGGSDMSWNRQGVKVPSEARATQVFRQLFVNGTPHTENLNLEGVGVTHHDASHHGRDEGKIAQLALIEEAEMRLFAEFLRKLRASTEGERTLLE